MGVCDSNSLVLASDVSTKELDDASLMEVCRIKSSGSSLHSLSNFGNKVVGFFTLLFLIIDSLVSIHDEKVNSVAFLSLNFCLGDCQVFSGQEVVKKAIDIADRFGKSTGLFLAVNNCTLCRM